MKKIAAVLIFIFTSTHLFSQINYKDYRRFSIDAEIGLPLFYGDIKSKVGSSFTFRTNFHVTSAFSVYGDLSLVNLFGQEFDNANKFNNNSFRFLVGGEAYLFNILRFNKISNFLQPFGGIGFGVMKNNFSKSTINNIELEEKNTDWHFTYQYTIGFKLYIINNLDVNAKFKVNYTKTDLLDNYNPDVVANKNNDAFVTFGAGITYHIGKPTKKPLIWNSDENYLFFMNNNIAFSKKNRNNFDLKNDSKSSTKQISTENPIYDSSEEKTDEDLDENEFDCIIKKL